MQSSNFFISSFYTYFAYPNPIGSHLSAVRGQIFTKYTYYSSSIAAHCASFMTQPENPVSSEKTKHPDQADALSVESIGWLFVQKYYSAYTGDIGKLFALYDTEASLLHDEFPVGSDHDSANSGAKPAPKTVHLAVGTDAIKAHFAAQTLATETNKIVVERAVFQKSVADSILIVVGGSWKRGSALLFQFVQTFVLRPKDKSVYDISNDVLNFLDFSEEYCEVAVSPVAAVPNGDVKEEKETEAATSEVAAPVEAPESVTESVSISATSGAAEEPEHAETTEVTEPTKAADVSEPSTAETPRTDDSERVESSTDTESEVSTSKSVEQDDKPTPPPVKQTWANLAAIEPKNGKPVKGTPAAKAVVKKATPPAPVVPANGKFRREDWYPIYIRNIEVDDDVIKGALTKQFGEIKFFKRNDKAALCDFRNKEDQQKALEAKEITIGNNVILLETRVHKPFNGKQEFKKEKKQVKKNGLKKN